MRPLDLREWGVVSSSGGGMPVASHGPEDIPGLLAWWDPDPTYVSLSGLQVTSWVSREGNAYSISQSTGSKRPTYESAGLLSMPALRFSKPSSQELGNNSIALAGLIDQGAPSTSYVVMTCGLVIGSFNSIWCIQNAAGTAYRVFGVIPAATGQIAWISNPTSNVVAASTVAANTPYYCASLYTGASITFRQSGVARNPSSTVNTNSPVCTEFYMGRDYRGGALGFYDGLIADVFFYDHVLTAGEITTLESWITAKYVGI